MTREEAQDLAGGDDEPLLFLDPAETFDPALVGVVEAWQGGGQVTTACYDRELVIERVISESDGSMTREEAEEHFAFNIAGSYVGPRTPVFLTRGES